MWRELGLSQGGWALELDIEVFFDILDLSHLSALLRQRVCDGVLCKLIDQWLKAGVMEDGRLSDLEDGTPQGGVISPILPNLYLHPVLDDWYETCVRPQLRGRSALIRCADRQ